MIYCLTVQQLFCDQCCWFNHFRTKIYKQIIFNWGLKATAEKIKEATDSLDSIEHQLDNNPELQLPEPQGLMTAKSYLGWENYHRINNLNGRLYSENKSLKHENSRLRELNNQLREQNKAYRLLEKVFGKRKLNEIIEQARGFKKSKQRDAR